MAEIGFDGSFTWITAARLSIDGGVTKKTRWGGFRGSGRADVKRTGRRWTITNLMAFTRPFRSAPAEARGNCSASGSLPHEVGGAILDGLPRPADGRFDFSSRRPG